jgi:hypothetical protein
MINVDIGAILILALDIQKTYTIYPREKLS